MTRAPRHLIWIVVVVIARAQSQVASSIQSQAPSEALQLLKQVTERYAEATTYYIQATEQQSVSERYSGGWTKTLLIAAEVPGRRFHFEAHSSIGDAVVISNGHTIWTRHGNRGAYTALAVSDGTSNTTNPALDQRIVNQARGLKLSLATLAATVSQARFLSDEALSDGDRFITCKVILISETLRPQSNSAAQPEESVWIDPEQKKILKVVKRSQTLLKVGRASAPADVETTIIYNTAFEDLPDCIFVVDSPDTGGSDSGALPTEQSHNVFSLVGRKLPSLKLRSPDGMEITTESLKGKPLLIDFWATWCAPCVAALPNLAMIYEETKRDGLTILALDQDRDERRASSFLQQRGYNWPDFHDPGGAIHQQLGYGGIPRILLVDSTGTVVYDGTGGNESELRARIGELGPQFERLTIRNKCRVPN